jgi:site-specific recombinase XerD
MQSRPRRRHPAGIPKPAIGHTVRHCFATHLLASGYAIRAVQELSGHKDIKMMRISRHVLSQGGLQARSSVEVL